MPIPSHSKSDFLAPVAASEFAPSNFFLSSQELTVTPPQNVIEEMKRAADSVGCEFIFEVPGVLFGGAHQRSALVEFAAYPGESVRAFILYDPDASLIQILDDADVPARARDFVQSYEGVLSRLGSLPSNSHLH